MQDVLQKPAPKASFRSNGAMEELDELARLLDARWGVPGTNIKFGLDALIGLVPGLGDVATALVSGYIIHRASQLGAPRALLARMIGNVALDTVVGSVPLIGSVFDLFFKANNRNVRLLRRHLENTVKLSRIGGADAA
jgi:hypothetical protein